MEVFIGEQQDLYITNLEIQHREWNGPSLVHLIGNEKMIYPCTANKRLALAWVIIDREVLVKYKTVNTYVIVPAFLLGLKSIDDREGMMKKTTR